MKKYWFLAIAAALVLTAAAVVLGGLNQDEGWYLYAAQLVGEGRMPYRDFFYTQGPLMPIVYSRLAFAWAKWGLLGARALTAVLGLAGCIVAVALARLVVPKERRNAAGLVAFMLLACNLYHLYFVSIPKTYSLAAFFVLTGFYLLVRGVGAAKGRAGLFFAAGLSLSFATGTRISLGALLAVCGFGLLFAFRRFRWGFLWFGFGGLLGLAVVYGPFLLQPEALSGLCAAQRYHAARGGFSPVFVVGSVSRLVRWYLPLFLLLGLAVFVGRDRRRAADGADAVRQGVQGSDSFPVALLFTGFLAVFVVQMLAPFPYEDYQVPVMGLLAVGASALAATRLDLPPPATGRFPCLVAEPPVKLALLTLGLAFATAFGSPLLEKWTTDGQDRFWTLKKEKPEIFLLKDAAAAIEALDPGGTTLLTQDLYLAIETRRKVPEGLEMGPFSILSDDDWRDLLDSTTCPVAAISGYAFAVDPPVCDERDPSFQEELRAKVRARYDLKSEIKAFGQNSTLLEIMKLKEAAK